MVRPASIRRFEQFYLASLALWVAAQAATWRERAAIIAGNPALRATDWLVPMFLIFVFALSVLLWYFVVRKPAVAAKWAVVVFAGLSAIVLCFGLFAIASGRMGGLVGTALGLATSGCNIAAAVYLFRPDAKAWFGETMLKEAEPRA